MSLIVTLAMHTLETSEIPELVSDALNSLLRKKKICLDGTNYNIISLFDVKI